MTRLSSELVLSLTDRVSGPARKVDKSLDALERRQRGAGRASRQTAEDVGMMGRAQSMALAGAARALAPVAGAFSAAQVVSSAADFETALTNIQKKAGATAEQTAKLGEEIKRLATSGELAVPIDEIAAAYERGAAAGIPLDDLRQFALLSAKAADAFEMSATDVGNASAGFNKVLGIPLEQMQRYFDLINGLADSGIADESGIVDYIDQGGAMAKTFGFTAQQTAALGAALANLKVSASKGATATNSILTRLMAPDALSSDGRTAYYQLIKDDKKFQKQLANGKAAEAFVEVLDKLKALDKETRTGIIVELFGQDHLDVMTQMVEGSDEVKRNLAYAAGDSWFGSLDNSYKLKLDDFWSRWQILKNDLATASIDIGNAGLPALKLGLEGVRDLIANIRTGMAQMEAKIDWKEVDAARSAVGDLGNELANLLGIKTEGSTLSDFFNDMSDVVNDVTRGVTAISRELKDIAAFARNPVEFMNRDLDPKATKERYGVEIWTPEEKARRVAEHRAANPDYAARDQQGVAMDRRWAEIGDQHQTDPRARPVEPAERGVRPRSEKPIPAFAPPMPEGTLPQPRFGAPPIPTPRQEPVIEPLGRTTGNIPVPTVRPDIERPVREEGERAAQAAEAAGARISDAFNVTATPTISTSSMDAYIARAQQAIALTNELGAKQARVRSQASSLGDTADYSGLHSDIED